MRRLVTVALILAPGAWAQTPAGDDLRGTLARLSAAEIIAFGESIKPQVVPQWKGLLDSPGLGLEQRRAVRVVLARAGDDDAVRLTLRPLCSTLFSSRSQVVDEIESLGSAGALPFLRVLLEMHDLLATQHPEDDQFDLPYSFRALKLLARLRPDSPAAGLTWLRIQVSRDERLTQSRAALAWLDSNGIPNSPPRSLWPTCLQSPVAARQALPPLDLAASAGWGDLAASRQALAGLGSSNPRIAVAAFERLLTEQGPRSLLAAGSLEAMFPYPAVATGSAAEWSDLLKKLPTPGFPVDWDTLIESGVKQSRSLELVTIAWLAPQVTLSKVRELIGRTRDRSVRLGLEAIAAVAGDSAAWRSMLSSRSSDPALFARACYALRSPESLQALRQTSSPVARELLNRLSSPDRRVRP